MGNKPSEAIIDKFLEEVIEIEESPLFMLGAQESARRAKILEALDKLKE